MTPPLSSSIDGTAGVGSAAAASSAAIFGPAWSASLDQPADSRILANWIGPARPISRATSEKRAASWVHATVSGVSSAAMVRKRSSSAPQSWVAVVASQRQARRTAPASSGMVSSHEHIRRCLVVSAIVLSQLLVTGLVLPSRRQLAGTPGKVYIDCIESTMPEGQRRSVGPGADVYASSEIPLSLSGQSA